MEGAVNFWKSVRDEAIGVTMLNFRDLKIGIETNIKPNFGNSNRLCSTKELNFQSLEIDAKFGKFMKIHQVNLKFCR